MEFGGEASLQRAILKGVDHSALELQQRELEAAVKRKAKIKTARARGKGTSAQVRGTSAHGAMVLRTKVRLTQPLVQ